MATLLKMIFMSIAKVVRIVEDPDESGDNPTYAFTARLFDFAKFTSII
jgi:hypothetical protein